MVVLPPGKFMMGSPDTDPDRTPVEVPQRKVTIARPFAVGKFEVTFTEWEACVSGGGCTANASPGDEGWGKGSRPVINVSWIEAKQYVEWLSARTGKTYRLLTEAEWEYSARAGTTTVYPWGDDAEAGTGYENCGFCDSRWANKLTAPVGTFKPNAFGLHDMIGNVAEWVEDCADDYVKAPADGSVAPETPKCIRVLRGGTYVSDPEEMRSATRKGEHAGWRAFIVGFRVARDLPSAKAPAGTDPPPEQTPAEPSSAAKPAPPPPLQTQSPTTRKADRTGSPLSEEEAQRIVTEARKHGFIVPSFVVEAPGQNVHDRFRRLVGIWADWTGKDGSSRKLMLIVTRVDKDGNVDGYWMSGPPGPKSFNQGPGATFKISGKVSGDVLRFKNLSGGSNYKIAVTDMGSANYAFANAKNQVDTRVLTPVWLLVKAQR